MNEKGLFYVFYFANAAIWAATAGLWYALWFFNPYTYRSEITAQSIVLFGLALLGVYFSYKQRPRLLVGLALISLLPMGLYLLATQGLFAYIGLLNLAGLFFGILVAVSDSESSLQSRN